MTVAIDLSRRAPGPELMDADDLDYPEFDACLRDLAKVNGWSLAYRATLTWFARLVERSHPAKAFRILDVGCGHGDMARRIARWARRRSVPVEIVGIDRNPFAKRSAEARTPADLPIRYVTTDLFEYWPDEPVDVVISSLFTHHLTDGEVVDFLVWMDQTARFGWFINDLRRHWLPYVFLRVAFPLLRLDHIVVHDGPVSVSRSFVRDDWKRLVDLAGLDGKDVRIERFFPYRFGVGRIK